MVFKKGMEYKMKKEIPKFLKEMLNKNYGEKLSNEIVEGYKLKKPLTLRINTLKTNVDSIKTKFQEKKIMFKEIKWNKEAFIIENLKEEDIRKMDIYENGEVYLQSLSSMIPVLVLDPKENDNILDMAAAPGGKTAQIATLSKNEAMITACEKNKIRFERLKYNLDKQGARANLMLCDARKLDDFFSFDKILLDSPCSGSGTVNVYEDKFSNELIDRSIKLQEELLKKAIKILKKGGELVYSTCSILKEENENVLNKVLEKSDVEIVKISEEDFDGVPLIPSIVDGTICVKPDNLYEGFFIAKLKKRK